METLAPLDRTSAASRVQLHLDCAAGTLALARALVQSGRQIDLTGFDQDIGAVCAGILDLDPGERSDVQGRMVTLVAEIDAVILALGGSSGG